MADKKLSELVATTDVTNADELIINQADSLGVVATKKISAINFLTKLFSSSPFKKLNLTALTIKQWANGGEISVNNPVGRPPHLIFPNCAHVLCDDTIPTCYLHVFLPTTDKLDGIGNFFFNVCTGNILDTRGDNVAMFSVGISDKTASGGVRAVSYHTFNPLKPGLYLNSSSYVTASGQVVLRMGLATSTNVHGLPVSVGLFASLNITGFTAQGADQTLDSSTAKIVFSAKLIET